MMQNNICAQESTKVRLKLVPSLLHTLVLLLPCSSLTGLQMQAFLSTYFWVLTGVCCWATFSEEEGRRKQGA